MGNATAKNSKTCGFVNRAGTLNKDGMDGHNMHIGFAPSAKANGHGHHGHWQDSSFNLAGAEVPRSLVNMCCLFRLWGVYVNYRPQRKWLFSGLAAFARRQSWQRFLGIWYQSCLTVPLMQNSLVSVCIWKLPTPGRMWSFYIFFLRADMLVSLQ